MEPCITELKEFTKPFGNCFSCFSQQRQQVSLSHTSVRLYHVLHLYLEKIYTDSNNSTLDANLSETIIQIAKYDKGTKQRQRKAIPSAHLK